MKSKIILFLLFLCVINTSTSAQQRTEADFSSGVSGLMAWIVNMDDFLTSIKDREKLRKLYRLLGNINLELDNIYGGKVLLAFEISKKENLNDNTQLRFLDEQIGQIKEDIEDLLTNLHAIKGLVNQTNQAQIDAVIREIDAGFRYKKLIYLKDLRAFLFKKTTSYNKILEEANESKQIAAESRTKITEARAKIIAALQK